MKITLKDTTRDAVYGELRTGDVVEVDEDTGRRWTGIGLAGEGGGDLRRAVAAEPVFARGGAPPVYGALTGRDAVAGLAPTTYPTNVAPEIHAIVQQQAEEIARLRTQLAGASPDAAAEPGASVPADADPYARYDLTEEQVDALRAAGYGHPDDLAGVPDEDVLAVHGIGRATLAKLRG